MSDIVYIDRQTNQKMIEKVYHGKFIKLLYGDSWIQRFVYRWFTPCITRNPFFSSFYGYLQKLPSSISKIKPFIDDFKVDTEEFLEPISHFRSFNDFFIRRLKSSARPFAKNTDEAIIPADGRYYFYENIDTCDGFIIKGQKFDLFELLQNKQLAQTYRGGSIVLARLCPYDYHRFHFPCDCLPNAPKLINGWLQSVNPLAVKKNVNIFCQNKRVLSILDSENFGKIAYIDVGATNVGSIKQTYQSGQPCYKGQEKGYFEFGGSALILLFEKNRITFDEDLLLATAAGFEIRCLLGQRMGCSNNSLTQ